MEDKDFYRELIKEQNKNIKENNKIMIEQLNCLDEIKIALQSKPCMCPDIDKVVNKGWENNTIKVYKWIIGSLFVLITGILGAIGLYKIVQ